MEQEFGPDSSSDFFGPHAVRLSGGERQLYDKAGRRVSGGDVQEVEYASSGLPIRIRTRSGGETGYLYDASGSVARVASQAEQSVRVRELFEERWAAGTTVAFYRVMVGGRPVATRVLGTGESRTTYTLDDQVGSTTLRATAEGVVVDRLPQDPLGRLLEGPTERLEHTEFAGHRHESASGLVNMRGRFYDPATAQFLSPDPVTSSPHVAQSLNAYAYALGNPTTFTDPTGLDPPFGRGRTFVDRGEPTASSGFSVPVSTSDSAPETGDAVSRSRRDASTSDLGPEYDRAVRGFEYLDWWVHGTAFVGGAAAGVPAVGLVGEAGATAWAVEATGTVQAGAAQVSAGAEVLAIRVVSNGLYRGAHSFVGQWALGEVGMGVSAVGAGGAALGEVADDLSRAGAGGSWPVIGETAGGAIAQITRMSCGAACGEMVSGIPQAVLISRAQAPTSAQWLAAAMGSIWRGGWVGHAQLPALLGRGLPFIAELRSPGQVGGVSHMVVVDGIDAAGHLLIRDPWGGGTVYRMTSQAFDIAWTGAVVFR